MVLDVDVCVDASTEDNLKQGVLKILKLIRPSWNLLDVHYKIYTEGISNALIGAWCEDIDQQILVRVYGENTVLFIDRKSEIDAFKLLHSHGLGSELYATFKNGICYEYATGDPLTPSTVTEEHIYTNVAKQLAAFNKLPIKDKTPQLFPKMKVFLSHYSDDLKEEHARRLSSVAVDKAYLESEMAEMEALVASLNCPIVFSHNDVLLQNIIWNKKEQSITFIDFEYACPNYQGFDIADHFVEFAGVDIDMDYSLYPSPEFQSKWIRIYLRNYFDKEEDEIDDDLVQSWLEWIKTFSLTAHLLWTCWSIVQAHHSKIDFDFVGYGIARIQEYRRLKKKFLPQ